MSLVLNMVGGGSGGGISGNTAVLEVIAPVGSSVSITDGVTTKTQTSVDGHPVSDRQTVAAYIFPVGSDELGNWTITATRGTDSNTTIATISAVMDYVVYIGYHVPIDIYQEVEFIQTTGTQYLDLNLTANKNTSFETDFMTMAARSNNPFLAFGRNNQTASKRGNFSSDATYGFAAWFNNDYRSVVNPYTISTYKDHLSGSFSSSGISATVYHNGVTYPYSLSYTPGTMDYVYLCFATNGSSPQYGSFRIYNCTILNDNTVQRELFPCYRLSDSVAGMYDKANGVFYTNSGSGTFTVGADI